MKQFHVSHYPSREYMLESKSAYYKALCKQLLEELEVVEIVAKNSLGEWYWAHTGERVGDDL